MSTVDEYQRRATSLAGRNMFDHDRVLRVSEFIESTGAVALVEKWRYEDGYKPCGPKQKVSDHAVLVVFQLLVSEYNAFSIHEAAKAVMSRLSQASLDHLGLTSSANLLGWEQRFRRALERVTVTFDPFIGPNQRRLTISEAKAEHDRRKADPLHSVKQKRIDEFSDCLTFGHLQWVIPQDVQARYRGNFTIDGTSMPIVSKFRGHQPRRDSAAVDVSAAWWGREGNHRHDGVEPPEDNGPGRSGKGKYGYEADLLMWSTNDPTRAADFPLICPVVRLKRPGHKTGELALDMVQSLTRHGFPARTLISDMAIAPGSKVEKLQEPLFDMGVDLCIHIDKAHIGRNLSGHEGLIWVDGNPYCEAMPSGLISATKDHLEGRISRDMLFRRLIERKRYLAKPNGKPNAKGAVQYIHPTERGRHVCNPERKGAQKFCKQRTVLVPKSKLELKYRQRFSYLSAEWARLHYAGRSSIEGFNGLLKNRKQTAVDEPARVPVRGYAVKYLATTMAVITANTKVVERFNARTDETLAAEATARAKRRNGASAEVYHDPQFWIDLAMDEDGRDLLDPEEHEN